MKKQAKKKRNNNSEQAANLKPLYEIKALLSVSPVLRPSTNEVIKLFMMNINDRINANEEDSVFVMVFKNRRWDDWKGWIYDDRQQHTIKKDRLTATLQKLNEQGYYEAGKKV